MKRVSYDKIEAEFGKPARQLVEIGNEMTRVAAERKRKQQIEAQEAATKQKKIIEEIHDYVKESRAKGQVASSVSQKKGIKPIKLPPDTKWENITIKFKDGHNVDIKVDKKIIKKSDYKEMGFEDRRQRKPNRQWELLIALANAKVKGRLSWEDSEASRNRKKQKQLLSQGLKVYFQITSDPFLNYKKEKAYQIKINLIPE